MAIEIRLPELEEVDDFYRNSGRVFGWDIRDQEIPRHKAFLELDRTMLAFDEGNMVGGLTSYPCLLYTSPSPRDLSTSRMPSSA